MATHEAINRILKIKARLLHHVEHIQGGLVITAIALFVIDGDKTTRLQRSHIHLLVREILFYPAVITIYLNALGLNSSDNQLGIHESLITTPCAYHGVNGVILIALTVIEHPRKEESRD